jgi:hypothetical protein
MSEESDLHEGSCLCKHVRYRVRGEPLEALACHCTACQRRTGSAFAIEVFFKDEQIEFLGAVPTEFEQRSDESGRWLKLAFCARCGSSIGLTAERRPGQRAVTGGTFDDPNWFRIGRHIWTRSKLHWVEIPEGVECS